MMLLPLKPSHTPRHPSEAAAAPGAAAIQPARLTALGTLLGSHVLRDGELVLLILKPSLWFIVFNSLLFAIVVAFIAVAAVTVDRLHEHIYLETGLFFISGSLMWSVLQWMG